MPENLNDNSYNEGYQEPVMAPGCPGQLYTVKSGDTMFFIARRFNISLQSLINANPQILDPNTIYPGQVICIPVGGPTPGVVCPGGRIYRVVSGDTMFEIARRFGVTLDALIQANPQITNPDLIFPGQEICVPVSMGPVPCPGGMLYVVKKGDTLFEIAKMNGISLTALIMANPQIPDPNLIYPGQTICIPKPAVEQPVMPVPLPAPVPEMPILMPKPIPMPAPPVVSPIVSPPLPSVPPVMPCPPAAPVSPVMPYPPAAPMTQPMPVYVVVPWEECPYRERKRKKGRHRQGCR